jgi:hypothetical protein
VGVWQLLAGGDARLQALDEEDDVRDGLLCDCDGGVSPRIIVARPDP